MPIKLEGDGRHLDPIIPKSKPSALLFVDKFSDSSEIRSKSKAALRAFRQLGLHYQISDQMMQQNDDRSARSSAQDLQGHRTGHPRLKRSSTVQKIKLKDKMSIMVLNEGKFSTLEDVASNLQGSSLHEILVYLLQQKKESKLSSVAKELGFHLLSDDSDIKISDSLPSETKVEPQKVSVLSSKDNAVGTSIDLDTNSASDHNEGSEPADMQSSSEDNKEKATKVDTQRPLVSAKPHQLFSDLVDISGDVKVEEKGCLEMGEECLHFQSFGGPFFFCDGNYQLLNSLTGETRIPSLVILNPISQQHYVYHEETFNYSLLDNFLSAYINGSLVPYQHSDSQIGSPREGTLPPLVNQDFHEVNSIPRVIAHTFYNEVHGHNQANDDGPNNAWNGDVLVLFSNSWCGFCQRMELVVREVYRALKGYMNMLKTRSKNGETGFSGDNLKNAILKLPKIFLMDCTLNDCSSMLKSVDQRELYPALLLFPAERKTAVPYEGDIAVADIIRFIADHGRNCEHLTSDKGILRTTAGKGGQDHNLFKSALQTAIPEAAAVAKDKSHEILLKNRVPKKAVEHSLSNYQASKDFYGTTPSVVVGSILTATEKISLQPFDKSEVLIVKADQTTGFQGLIYNKPIRWDSLHHLEEGYELLKEAPLYFGGPLIKRGWPFVALSRRAAKDQRAEVLPGIYFLDQLATVNEIEKLKSGNRSINDYWIFLGFSSWNGEQLFDEIAQGAWSLRENVDSIDLPLRMER
uniref:Thioredoxin domain-containing protein n=1 Tax=Rhizophora mucronata TaxID=61149 RepID=A0A2P2LVW2_RHIMU